MKEKIVNIYTVHTYFLCNSIGQLAGNNRKEMAVRQRAVAALPTLLRALRKEGISKQNQPLPSLRRAFSLYDQINLIDNVPEDQLRFQE